MKMDSKVARALARLEQRDAIELQMRLHMFFAKIYIPLAKSYKSMQESFEEHGLGLDHNTMRFGNLTAAAHDGRRKRAWCQRSGDQLGAGVREQPEESVSTNRRGSPVTNKLDDQDWDWRGIPELYPLGRLHSYISTGWMIYASLRAVFLEQLTMLVNPLSTRWFGMPGNCLMLGRFLTHPTMNFMRVIWLSSHHLIWRFVQAYLRQGNKLTMVLFLLQSDRDIEHFYERMEANRTGEYLPPTPIRSGTSINLCEVDRVQGRQLTGGKSNSIGAILHLRQQCISFRKIQADTRETREHRDDEIALRQRVTAQEHLMRHLTCYKVYHGDRVHFRLRPNRTRQARKKLIGQVARSSLLGIAIFATLAFIVAIYVFFLIFSDVRYVLNYPGCYPLLDKLYAEGRLRIYDFTLKEHHLISSLIDSVENLIVWADTGLAIVFVPVLAYLLNYDILLYWSELQQKLELLLEKTRLSNELHMRQIRQSQSNQSSECPAEIMDDEIFEERWHANRWQRHPQAAASSSTNRRAMWMLERELEDKINELQFEMCDFFHEVRRADRLIGDILTSAIVIWLSSCAFIGYYGLVRNKSTIPKVLQLILCLGFIVVASISYFLLELRRSCLRSYQTLASLTANDRTLKKRQLIKMLDFFTQLNRITYRLFQLYPYKPTTFITIIGWSFSCFFIVLTLFGGHSLMVQ